MQPRDHSITSLVSNASVSTDLWVCRLFPLWKKLGRLLKLEVQELVLKELALIDVV